MGRILAILIVLTCSMRAETVQGLAKPTGYVSDYAGVLDPDAKASIEAQCTAIHQKTGTQIAVVTIHHLEDQSAQDFAQGISDAWHVGSKGSDKGVVMLFSIDDHKRWINIGYGLEGQLNDAKVGDIGRDMVPFLKEAHYREAIGRGVADVGAAISADPSATPPPAPAQHQGDLPVGLILLCTMGGVIVVLVLIVRFRSRQSTMGEVRHTLGMPIITPISYNNDTSNFSSTSSSDSGSDSSGSQSSNQSSGSDFGGFDGGSSGGGGAGGDW